MVYLLKEDFSKLVVGRLTARLRKSLPENFYDVVVRCPVENGNQRIVLPDQDRIEYGRSVIILTRNQVRVLVDYNINTEQVIFTVFLDQSVGEADAVEDSFSAIYEHFKGLMPFSFRSKS